MDFLASFLIGGLICAIVQTVIDMTKLTPARILVGLVVLGVILQGFGLYQPLVDFAGCGATVPLTGFGYNLAKGTQKMVGEYGWIGILTGPFSAGAAGISTALISGLIVSLLTKPRGK